MLTHDQRIEAFYDSLFQDQLRPGDEIDADDCEGYRCEMLATGFDCETASATDAEVACHSCCCDSAILAKQTPIYAYWVVVAAVAAVVAYSYSCLE
jgi:hypothetical protein